jgi:hypothetical protein
VLSVVPRLPGRLLLARRRSVVNQLVARSACVDRVSAWSVRIGVACRLIGILQLAFYIQ